MGKSRSRSLDGFLFDSSKMELSKSDRDRGNGLTAQRRNPSHCRINVGEKQSLTWSTHETSSQGVTATACMPTANPPTHQILAALIRHHPGLPRSFALFANGMVCVRQPGSHACQPCLASPRDSAPGNLGVGVPSEQMLPLLWLQKGDADAGRLGGEIGRRLSRSNSRSVNAT